MPRIAKTAKKNKAKAKMLDSCKIEERSVETNILILPNAERDLKGLNSLKVLNIDTLSKLGRADNIPVTTTIKSSQFQASLK